jgi:spermidine/putrescine transport system ATP-binding protein
VPDIEIRAVVKRFGDFTAVREVSLAVAPGEFLTLLGPSGCGKTTILRLVAGFERPDAGEIFLGGENVTELPPYRRNVRTVFQHYALFPHMTAAGNIAFGLEQKRLPRREIAQKVAAAIDLVRLDGLADRYPRQLSGGQQQRVAIARALVCEPRVLLLDEPLGALDLKLRRAMQTELKSLQRRTGIAFIFVTHDQEEALAMSDRVAVMNKGRIEQIGAPREIYESPRTEFVASFIGVCNILRGTVCGAESDGVRVACADGTVTVAFASAPRVGDAVTFAIRPEKIAMSRDLGGEAMLAGTVVEHVYLGNASHWTLQLADGQRVTVFRQNDGRAAASDFQFGERAYLRWEAKSGVPLSAAGD